MRSAAVLALMLLGSACASAGSTTTVTTPATAATTTTAPLATTTTATTIAATSPTPPVATTSNAAPSVPSDAVVVGAGEPIRIAVLQSISGGTAPFGTGQAQAIELAVEQFGPVHGFGVDVGEPHDDQCTHDGGTAVGMALAAEPDVVAVIGPTCSGAAVPALRFLSEAGIPLISASTTTPELTSDTRRAPGGAWRPGFFRVSPNDARQAVTAARFAAEELGARRAVAIHTGDPYTVTLAETFAATLADRGGATTTVRCKLCDEEGVAASLDKAAAAEPDVLFLPLFRPESDLLLARYRSVAGLEDVAIIGGEGLAVDELLAAPDAAGIHLVLAGRDFAGSVAATGVSYEQYRADYAARYGEPPTEPGPSFDADAYDATILLLTALADVAEPQGDSLVIDRAALRARLHATRGLAGLTGTLACDRFGDCSGLAFVVVRHDDPADPAATRANAVYRLAPPPPDPECRATVTETGSVLGPEVRLSTIDDIEAWGLIFPHGFPMGQGDPVRLPVGEELKIVFRVTGRGDPTINAIGPGGLVVTPTDGPDRHEGSNWRRPGDEFGTGWVLPEPGCWTFLIRRDREQASLVAEAHPP